MTNLLIINIIILTEVELVIKKQKKLLWEKLRQEILWSVGI